MRKWVQGVQRLGWILCYQLSRLVPRNPNLWAFGSWHGRRFADNTKWLFLHVHESPPMGVRPIWVTRSRAVEATLQQAGLPVVRLGTVRGVLTALRAGVYLFDAAVDDVSFSFAGGARRINLWHGVALKQIERHIEKRDHPRWRAYHGSLPIRLWARLKSPWVGLRPHRMVATGDEPARVFSEAFDVPRPHVWTTGYPRTDPLLADTVSDPTTESPFLAEIRRRRAAGQVALVYMPTFRDTARAGRALPFDWERVQEALVEIDGFLLLKLHSHDTSGLPDLSAFDRVDIVPAATDPYPLVRDADALISDYSSIFFDFLLTDRAILFYAYDLDAYRQADRAHYYPYEDVAAGPICRSFDALLEAVGRLRTWVEDPSTDPHTDQRADVRARFYRYVDGRGAERVSDAVASYMAREG